MHDTSFVTLGTAIFHMWNINTIYTWDYNFVIHTSQDVIHMVWLIIHVGEYLFFFVQFEWHTSDAYLRVYLRISTNIFGSDVCNVHFFHYKVVVLYLAVFKIIQLQHCHPKPSIRSLQTFAGKLIKHILKYCRNSILFLFCVISSRGRQRTTKCTADAHFGACLYKFINSLSC